jgi:phosphoribosylglycinamide formyltransferase 1
MNIVVFASGRGSNFIAILDAVKSGFIPARISLLISNNSDAGAMVTAQKNGIPTRHLSLKMFQSQKEYSEAMLKILSDYKTDLIALAGYMKKIPAEVIRNYKNRIVNIHPALLPSFGGKGMYGHFVHEAVISSGAGKTGASVHFVDEEYDRGPVILQKSIDVSAGDTPDSIAEKVLKIEHEIYPLTIKAFAEGKIKIEGQKAWIT